MKNDDVVFEFTVPLEKFEDGLWVYHIKIPADVYKELNTEGIDRVLCYLNDHGPIHAGFMPAGQGVYFIMLNQKLVNSFGLMLGATINVRLLRDPSEYGMPLPEELEEMLIQDPEASYYFHALTRGKQRALIYIVGKMKKGETRAEKAAVIINHLLNRRGVMDFRELNEEMREASRFRRKR